MKVCLFCYVWDFSSSRIVAELSMLIFRRPCSLLKVHKMQSIFFPQPSANADDDDDDGNGNGDTVFVAHSYD